LYQTVWLNGFTAQGVLKYSPACTFPLNVLPLMHGPLETNMVAFEHWLLTGACEKALKPVRTSNENRRGVESFIMRGFIVKQEL
jgi:hypothetical protein